MTSDRLVSRYREAIEFYRSPVSHASRLIVPDERDFCTVYVRDSYKDRSKHWDADQHREAYEAAREGAGDVLEMDVSEM